jgi:hypothetical protein
LNRAHPPRVAPQPAIDEQKLVNTFTAHGNPIAVSNAGGRADMTCIKACPAARR